MRVPQNIVSSNLLSAGFARLTFVLLLAMLAFSASAEIFKWVDSTGKIHFSDEPPKQAKTEKLNIQINSFTSPVVSPFKFDPSLISKRKISTDVVMYSTTWCGVCRTAKRYFNENKIPFEEYDVEKTKKGKKDYKKLNGKGVPLILVGDKRMSGFSVASFEKIYQQ